MAYYNINKKIEKIEQELRAYSRGIIRLKHNIYYLIIITVLQIISWGQALFIYHNLNGDFLVLHYNVDYGIDLVLDPKDVFFWPLLALFIFIINTFILLGLYKINNTKFFSNLLLLASILVNFLVVLSLVSIYLINFK